MIDRVTDVFNNIKERFSSPLFFSFACAWLIINWEVTLSLFVDKTQIEKEGANTIFQFITKQKNTENFILKPLGVAIAYTILAPLVKNLIKIFNSRINRWGENWSLAILKRSNVSLSKYIKLREDYENRSKTLEEIISKENIVIEESRRTETQNMELQSQILNIKAEIIEKNKFINELTDFRKLDGKWENTYTLKDGRSDKEDIYISDGRYYVYESDGQQNHVFNITHFWYDNRNGNISFIKELTPHGKTLRPQHEHFNINHLKFHNKDFMAGMENYTTKIAYRRQDEQPISVSLQL